MTNATEIKQGEQWKNERYFSTFEDADALRKSLKTSDRSGTQQFKIKRCGVGGTTYVVKSRVDPSLKAALEEIEEKMMRRKDKKTSK
jgi:D-tyrosyl-tRNA(Tyr) deacylase